MPDLATILTNAPCIVENPWGAQWDGPCASSHLEGGGIHIPCAIAALESVDCTSLLAVVQKVATEGSPEGCGDGGWPCRFAGAAQEALEVLDEGE